MNNYCPSDERRQTESTWNHLCGLWESAILPAYHRTSDFGFSINPLLTVSSHRRLGFQTSKKSFKTLVWVIGSVFMHNWAPALSLQERTLQKNYKDIWHFPKEQNHDTQFRRSGGKRGFLRVHGTLPIYVHLSTWNPKSKSQRDSQYRLNTSEANGKQTSWLLGYIAAAQEIFHILRTVLIVLFWILLAWNYRTSHDRSWRFKVWLHQEKKISSFLLNIAKLVCSPCQPVHFTKKMVYGFHGLNMPIKKQAGLGSATPWLKWLSNYRLGAQVMGVLTQLLAGHRHRGNPLNLPALRPLSLCPRLLHINARSAAKNMLEKVHTGHGRL